MNKYSVYRYRGNYYPLVFLLKLDKQSLSIIINYISSTCVLMFQKKKKLFPIIFLHIYIHDIRSPSESSPWSITMYKPGGLPYVFPGVSGRHGGVRKPCTSHAWGPVFALRWRWPLAREFTGTHRAEQSTLDVSKQNNNFYTYRCI